MADTHNLFVTLSHDVRLDAGLRLLLGLGLRLNLSLGLCDVAHLGKRGDKGAVNCRLRLNVRHDLEAREGILRLVDVLVYGRLGCRRGTILVRLVKLRLGLLVVLVLVDLVELKIVGGLFIAFEPVGLVQLLKSSVIDRLVQLLKSRVIDRLVKVSVIKLVSRPFSLVLLPGNAVLDHGMGIARSGIMGRTHLIKHAQHGSNGCLVVVGALGIRRKALVDGINAEEDQRQRGNEAQDPQHAARHLRHEAEQLEDAQDARNAHADGRDGQQQRLEARDGRLVQQALARRVIVRDDDDGAVALDHQRTLGAMDTHHVLAAGTPKAGQEAMACLL